MEWTQPAGGSAMVQNHPQPPAPPSTASVAASNAKKRPLEDIKNSPYYKMRAIVRDLRPHFMEVLGAPDFRNCKGAEEIREKMKIFMTLYKEMMNDTTTEQVSSRPSATENKRFFTGTGSASQTQQAPAVELGGVRLEGTYVVGGSAFGWNYVTFPGSKSVYYGRTKEEFRAAAAAKSQ